MHASRRHFLKSAAAVAAGCAISDTLRASDSIADLDVRITRAVVAPVNYLRPRDVGGNSKYRRAGNGRRDFVLFLFGDNGKIGIGSYDLDRSDHKKTNAGFLIGKTVGSLLTEHVATVNKGQCTTGALWDLAGKTLDKPLYELLGGKAPDAGVPVYDGSIYHEELLARDSNCEYRNPASKLDDRPNWDDIIREAIDVSRDEGHNFAKIKIGRGKKHLCREAGNAQDAAVLRLIREHAGDDYGIGVDANNGYELKDTLWLLRDHGDVNLAFIEEMFSDDVEKYQRVRELLDELKLKTLIADGESWRGPDDRLGRKVIDSGVVDILQGDMRQFRIEGILEESRLAQQAGHGSRIAPHNWGSEFGFYMQVHIGCSIPNFYRAEHDPGRHPDGVLIKHGYDIKDGYCTNFDSPGIGVDVNRKKLERLKTLIDIS